MFQILLQIIRNFLSLKLMLSRLQSSRHDVRETSSLSLLGSLRSSIGIHKNTSILEILSIRALRETLLERVSAGRSSRGNGGVVDDGLLWDGSSVDGGGGSSHIV